MNAWYPPARMLAARLTAMIADEGAVGRGVEVLSREPAASASTFPSEIVTCRIGDQAPMTLLCKYSRARLPAWHVSHGHRHGVAFEAQVYQHVLAPAGMSTPDLRGTYDDPKGRTWLVLEYLDGCVPAKSAPGALEAAAAWIGRFHASTESRVGERALDFVPAYSADYYLGWARRTMTYARRYRRDSRDVNGVCQRFVAGVGDLLEGAATVVHGEFYPANVLWRAGRIHPVDWESAAVGAGEIDLAALTEHWSDEVSERCERAYVQARWPAGGPDAAFARRLSAARIYMLLRWSGVAAAWKSREGRSHYFERFEREWSRLKRAEALQPSSPSRATNR